MTSFFPIFLIGLFCQNGKALTIQQCNYQTGECLEALETENFGYEYVNNLFQQNPEYKIFGLTSLGSELTVNFDNFDNSITIRFDNQESLQLTIETNVNKISSETAIPNIDASNVDIIIDNTNNENDKSLIVLNSFSYKSLANKNANRPLYLVQYRNNYQYPHDILASIKSDIVYVGSHYFYLDLSQTIENSFTIVVSPFLNYTSRYEYDDPSFVKESSVYTRSIPENTIITYGKKQIKYEFPNKKVITLITETSRISVTNEVRKGNIINIEDGLNGDDVIIPKVLGNEECTLKGNWPIIKSKDIPGEFLENGSYIDEFYSYPRIEGIYLYSANNFPIDDFYSNFKLILTEKSSSIYLTRNSLYDNMTIETRPQNPNDEFHFYFEGKCIKFKERYYGEDKLETGIITTSDKLTIYGNTYSKINVFGPASIIYRKIDNSEQEVDTTLPFLQGGTIISPYSVDFDTIAKSCSQAYNSYKESHPEPENGTVSQYADYYINFAKEKIGDLADTFNEIANQIIPVRIDLKSDSSSQNQKSKIIIARNDFPFAPLYQKGLNKVSNAVCVENGKMNIDNWDIRIGSNILRNMFGSDSEEESDMIFEKYFPKFSDTKIEGDIALNDDGKCISYKQTSIPGSTFELIIYTSNTTFSEIFEKVDLIITLTPDDLDASSRLKNAKSKNFIVVILDDVPDGKAINLNGIREDANIFLFGYKSDQINEIYDMIQKLDDLNWTEYKDNQEEYDRLQNEIMIKFAAQYQKYMPKASITFGTVQSFMVGLINYAGTHIKCTNFYPILSKFSNLDALAKDFSAKTTLTETVTYKVIAKLPFNDLVLFPATINPPNIYDVEKIDFTETKWKLKLTGLVSAESSDYEINTDKVSGQLIIYSFSSNCIFNVPETKDNQNIRGITVNSHFTNFNINEIPGIMILEDKMKSENLLKAIPKKIFDSFTSVFTDNSQLLKPKEEAAEKITFQGNWNKVKTITGTIEINTGDQPALIDKIPAVVASVLEVKSSGNIQLDTTSDKMKFSQPQIIKEAKTISFTNEKMDVSFSNLTFIGSSTSFSLLLNGKASNVITDHIYVSSVTNAFLRGDLEVKESFEFGPSSSLEAKSIKSDKPKLTMDYRLNDNFGKVPDSVQPGSIVLNYIGESNNIDEFPDYSSYLGSIHDVKTFEGNGHLNKCNEWKGKTSLESYYYPEFKGENPVVSVLCIDKSTFSTLSVNVTRVPTGVVIIPESPNDETGRETPKEKKKFPIGAIIGIVVGGVALIAIISVLVWYFAFKKKKVSNSENTP
ncbi:hypothetical protein M9Y10_018668 [Tritrichomonas musculus]|uniref:VWFA domain-containing protein n=1 Tax=Tritrichomonas musculus TaxID=1915356 RepID=A0ABR2HP36_9EUKA